MVSRTRGILSGKRSALSPPNIPSFVTRTVDIRHFLRTIKGEREAPASTSQFHSLKADGPVLLNQWPMHRGVPRSTLPCREFCDADNLRDGYFFDDSLYDGGAAPPFAGVQEFEIEDSFP